MDHLLEEGRDDPSTFLLVGMWIGPIGVILYQTQSFSYLVKNFPHTVSTPFFPVSIGFSTSTYINSLTLLFTFCKHNSEKILEKIISDVFLIFSFA
jgi:hypothetical protein